jgi:hypothetical protein
MKLVKYAINTLVLLTGLGIATVASAGENSIRPGIYVNPVGSGAIVEYERLLNDKLGIGARLGTLSYTYSDGSYDEDGVGSGVEAILRYYPKGLGFDGFYVGGGVGLWSVAWEWTDPTDTPSADDGTASAVNVNVNLGWKIPLGSEKIYLDPAITIGNFFSSASDDSEVIGLYTAAQLGVGFVF